MKKLVTLISLLLLTSCAQAQNSALEFSPEDQIFAEMMIPHHEQAIVMADLALKISQTPTIRELAQGIRTAQGPEIEAMKRWGASKMGSHAGHSMNGMLTDLQMKTLSSAIGGEFDRLFLESMIEHHRGAIEMAEMVINSKNKSAAELGKAIIVSQQREIDQMRKLLS
ncbi:MAG: DUF305 domain-containing protein [Actinomycetota bacterium]|nr:DUF305 domain-containing protein [Actinomycetota bacterium]